MKVLIKMKTFTNSKISKPFSFNFFKNNDESEIDLDTDGLEADLASGNKDTCVLEVTLFASQA